MPRSGDSTQAGTLKMTIQLRQYQVDAFSCEVFSGNPAAVVLQEGSLLDSQMQQIAAENHLSETAFLKACPGSKVADFELRWFTPTHEVELCGHATLASAWVLLHRRGWGRPEVRFHTRSGILRARAISNRIEIDLPARESSASAPPKELSESLGGKAREIYRGANWIAVFDNAQQVTALRPDFRKLSALHPLGVIATAPGDSDAVDFVSRYFAPSFGIDEDPVTGSAHCDLAPYWSSRLQRNNLQARQVSSRGGDLGIRYDRDADRVFLQGECALFSRGEIMLPEITAR